MKNEKTGVEMFEGRGILCISNDVTEYGCFAVEDDIDMIVRFLEDHMPNVDVRISDDANQTWERTYLTEEEEEEAEEERRNNFDFEEDTEGLDYFVNHWNDVCRYMELYE